MKMVKYNPFRPMKFENILDDFANKSFAGLLNTDFVNVQPSVNVIENKDSFELEVAVPGISKENIKVEIEKDHLIISANSKSKDQDEKDAFYRREFNYSSFERSFHLSKEISRDKVTAKYDKGILFVRLEKTPESRNIKKSIEIG